MCIRRRLHPWLIPTKSKTSLPSILPFYGLISRSLLSVSALNWLGLSFQISSDVRKKKTYHPLKLIKCNLASNCTGNLLYLSGYQPFFYYLPIKFILILIICSSYFSIKFYNKIKYKIFDNLRTIIQFRKSRKTSYWRIFSDLALKKKNEKNVLFFSSDIQDLIPWTIPIRFPKEWNTILTKSSLNINYN